MVLLQKTTKPRPNQTKHARFLAVCLNSQISGISALPWETKTKNKIMIENIR